MADIAASEAAPSVTRVSDAYETAFSFATSKAPDAARPRQVQGADHVPASAAGFDVEAMCLSFIGYEGSDGHVAGQRKAVGRIVGRHGGLCIGASPGELYDQKKFDTPYIRDFLLDRGALADVSETAAPWSRLSGRLRHGDGGGARRVRRARRPRLRHVPPVALLPRRRVPVLHLRLQAPATGDGAARVRRRQVGDPAGVHRLGRDAVAPPRGRAPSTRAGSRRTSRRRASRCCGPCSRASIPERT